MTEKPKIRDLIEKIKQIENQEPMNGKEIGNRIAEIMNCAWNRATPEQKKKYEMDLKNHNV